MGLLGLFVVLRVVRPLPWPVWLKLALSLVILLTSVHHLWTRLAFGTMFAPEVPRAVVIAVNWIFGSTLLAAAFQVRTLPRCSFEPCIAGVSSSPHGCATRQGLSR